VNSYFGVSHLNYRDDIEGFLRALGRVQLWPVIGFLIPIGSLMFTRGFDISWPKGVAPPTWYGWMLAVCGFGFPFFHFWATHLLEKLGREINAEKEPELSVLLPKIYRSNTQRLWDLYYKTLYIGGIFIFLMAMTVSWGISGLIYFVIGLK
jgi:hypothetical protein